MPDDLVGITEIAQLANVVRSAVSNWLVRHDDFPEPWGSWACGQLWLRQDVIDWLAKRRQTALLRNYRAQTRLMGQLEATERYERYLRGPIE